MLDYLGFPDSQDDVNKLLKVVDPAAGVMLVIELEQSWVPTFRIVALMQDRDGDGSVSFDEFLHYVGKLGIPDIAEGKLDVTPWNTLQYVKALSRFRDRETRVQSLFANKQWTRVPHHGRGLWNG